MGKSGGRKTNYSLRETSVRSRTGLLTEYHVLKLDPLYCHFRYYYSNLLSAKKNGS